MARPRGKTTRTAIKELLNDFADRLHALIQRAQDGDSAAELRGRVLAALNGIAGRRRGPGRPRGSRAQPVAAAPRRNARKVSAKQRAAAKLQGAYMGLTRTLPAEARAKV